MTDQIQKEINEAGGKDSTPVKNAKAPVVKKGKAKTPAKKAAAKKAPAPKELTAKQLQAKADAAVKAEEKAAAKKIADAEKAAADKEKADKALVVKTERGIKPLINKGLKAMHAVGNGNKDWTIAAFDLRELCKGTPVNFKDAMEEGWGVAKNTATKLANAGQLMHELTTSEDQDVLAQLEYMPMGSVNNLSQISGFTDAKLEVGIDKGFIKFDATETEVSTFARDYNDKGQKVVVKDVPATPAAAAEDDADPDTGVSAAETPAELQARILLMTASMSDADALALIEAIEAQHPALVA